MIKKILLGFVAIIVLFLIVAAMQPEDYRVERSLTIAASPSALFDLVNDHKKFQKWNPRDKMDPESKTTYSGADSSVGAVASWKGEKVQPMNPQQPTNELESNHLFHVIRGTFAAGLGFQAAALTHFRQAGNLAALPAERDFIARRLKEIGGTTL